MNELPASARRLVKALGEADWAWAASTVVGETEASTLIRARAREDGRVLAAQWFDGRFHRTWVAGLFPANLTETIAYVRAQWTP